MSTRLTAPKYLPASPIALAVSCALMSSSAGAQSAGPPAPPVAPLIDENHVDFVSGNTVFPIKLLSIGSGDLGLSLTINYSDQGGPNNPNYAGSGVSGYLSNLTAYWEMDSSVAGANHYYIGFKQTLMNSSGGPYAGYSDGGSVVVNSDGSRVFTDREGTVMTFPAPGYGAASSVKFSNGKLLTYRNGIGKYTAGGPWSVQQNNGLLIKRDSSSRYVIVNLAYEYCDPNPAVTCALSQSWPTASETYSNSPSAATVTDSTGGTYQFTGNGYAITSYHDKNWAPGTVISYQRCTRNPVNCYWASSDGFIGDGTFQAMYDRVTNASKNGVNWTFNYVWNVGPHGYIYQSTSPIARDLNMWADPYSPPYIQYYKDNTTGAMYGFDFAGHVTGWSLGGEGASYIYDSRGNLTDEKKVPAAGSNLPTVIIHADYDATCAPPSSPAKCNKPNDVIDANNNRTDYIYDTNTGLLLTEKFPAVTVCNAGTCASIQPVKRYSYVQRSAWYLNSSGAYAKDPNPIWLLQAEKTCRTSSTDLLNDKCAVTADEVVKTYDYGPDSGPNNLWLRGVAVAADGVTRRTCYSYDRLGNKISETSPRAGLNSCP
jgi:hypothetical protein